MYLTHLLLTFKHYVHVATQSHCAVGEVYFALDPKTGITSQSEHDPWKWAQEVSEKMAVSEDSCLVFIAGPPAAMGVPLYRDLQNNQVIMMIGQVVGRNCTRLPDANKVRMLVTS